jgi:hypothetical protein
VFHDFGGDAASDLDGTVDGHRCGRQDRGQFAFESPPVKLWRRFGSTRLFSRRPRLPRRNIPARAEFARLTTANKRLASSLLDHPRGFVEQICLGAYETCCRHSLSPHGNSHGHARTDLPVVSGMTVRYKIGYDCRNIGFIAFAN